MQDILATLWTKIVKAYFHKKEDGKLGEKVFFCRIAVAVVSIILCLSAMGFSAYAYFTSSITSGMNTLTAATYSTEIVVNKEGSTDALTATPAGVVQNYQLEADTNYVVTIKASGSAQNGYCKVIVDATTTAYDAEYFTVQITPNVDTLTFDITCYEAATVGFITNWGSYSETDLAKIIEMPTEENGNKTEVLVIGEKKSNLPEAQPNTEQTSNEPATTSVEETTTTNSGDGETSSNSES